MSRQQQGPSIQYLDQMFANHFGLSPMTQNSNLSSSKSESIFSNSSSNKIATSNSSFTSSSNGNSPRTPGKGMYEDQLYDDGKSLQNQKYIRSNEEDDQINGIGLFMDEEERNKKAQKLLNALAELYATPVKPSSSKAPSVQSQGSRGSSISPSRTHREVNRNSNQRQEEVINISPKSTPKTLREENSTPTKSIINQSLRTSTSTTNKAFSNDGEDATIWPMEQSHGLHEVEKPEDVGILAARRQSKVGTESVRPMSLLNQVHYSVEAIPRRTLNDLQTKDELTTNFPHLCEAPHVIMFDDQGIALPPLKYEETSYEERKARKNALQISIRGKKMHTLIKSMVVLESRSTHWKKVGSKRIQQSSTTPTSNVSTPARQSSRSNSAPKLPEVPDPWSMNFMHSNKDTLNIKGTARRIFELSESRTYGQCPKCQGNGQDSCGTCKGAKPDECFWCEGSGREKVKQHLRCQPCNGTGQLTCKSCKGTLKSSCRSCEGEGQGEFCAYIQIKVRRVDFAPVPVTSMIASAGLQNASAIKEAAIARTWEAINKLTEVSGSKHKHPFRPLAAACYCQTSWSDLVEVQAPHSVKGFNENGQKHQNGEKSGGGLLRSRSLTNLRGHKHHNHNHNHHHQSSKMKKYFFVLPSDTDLQPAEIDQDEFELALMPDLTLSKPILNEKSNVETPASPSPPTKTVVSRALKSNRPSLHQRSHSDRVEQNLQNPIPISQSFNLADVTAWQARVQENRSNFQDMMLRPVSPTSQLASLPSTPDERYAQANYPNSDHTYFNSSFGSDFPISPRTTLPQLPPQQPQQPHLRRDYHNVF